MAVSGEDYFVHVRYEAKEGQREVIVPASQLTNASEVLRAELEGSMHESETKTITIGQLGGSRDSLSRVSGEAIEWLLDVLKIFNRKDWLETILSPSELRKLPSSMVVEILQLADHYQMEVLRSRMQAFVLSWPYTSPRPDQCEHYDNLLILTELLKLSPHVAVPPQCENNIIRALRDAGKRRRLLGAPYTGVARDFLDFFLDRIDAFPSQWMKRVITLLVVSDS
ncbi:unnamed protein product [Vitrella brassicaformis CCMP3155]|uniref:BTB domain-containing protein n=2 Tax=Vitrella brassicaformis TaxID=1169539 RepID=A0A0G4FCU3_VITBC|nr:unnamed protein product [Vitrella brassicaformis CCMP3155]|mmetsp:Transcript_44117/g.109964  ORF Transcript_44117/g.109964 Transcript_44117/m.109964 type:complete len:225 (+) Transcript_44117:103-777(+)|eukprot:CEM10985.1 unnamed protein product [Vitrella brassicaformis CCMP3155]